MIKKSLIFIILMFLIIPLASAQKGHMKLLAVSENYEEEQKGSIADLYLEIKEGNNNVYIDTFPLTKLDTQLSTRFAKEIACKYLNKDCSKLDFFYKIKAKSSIIGGPSAGAAIAALTAALLENKEINESVTLTGTINTGGIIGSVSGIKEKIDAASANNITKILIPKGSRYKIKINDTKLNKTLEEAENNSVVNIIEGNGSIKIIIGSNIPQTITINNISQTVTNTTNTSKNTTKEVSDKIDLIEYGQQKGIEIVEISTLDEALFHLAGIKREKSEVEIKEKGYYTETMAFISKDMCNRTKSMKDKITKQEILNHSEYKRGEELLNNSEIAFNSSEYYSAASFCFGANIIFDYLILEQENISISKRLNNIEELMNSINHSNKVMDEMELYSIEDLQTYMIIKERLVEAYDSITKAEEKISLNNTDVNYEIAYATERLYSAFSWSYFLNKSRVEFNINNEVIKNSCETTLNEAQERMQYLNLMYPYLLNLEKIDEELSRAYQQYDHNNYKMCLMHASKAKAEIDTILSAAGVEEELIGELVNIKLKLIEEILIEHQKNDLFPIEGYSYYQYAKTLSKTDNVSALIYAEYAIEFSNLDYYFEKIEQFNIKEFMDGKYKLIIAALIGLIIGIIVGYFGYSIGTSKNKKMTKSKKC